MLPSAHRLSKEEVEEVFRTGRPLFVMGIGARFLKNQQGVTKFAFVCGKKMLKSAVKRNRFKRLARVIVFSLQKNWPKGYTIVVFVAKRPNSLSREAFEPAIATLLEKIH